MQSKYFGIVLKWKFESHEAEAVDEHKVVSHYLEVNVPHPHRNAVGVRHPKVVDAALKEVFQLLLVLILNLF